MTASPARNALALSALLIFNLAGLRHGNALTIYRIGGTELPPPEIASESGVDFRQLSWADADEEKFGSAFLVETDGPLQPERLDPTKNLTPLLRSRGAEIKSSNGYGWQDEPLLDLAFDGNYETAYTGLGGSGFGLNCGTFTAARSCKTVWIQFRGFFPIRRLVLQPTPDHHVDRFMPNLQVGTNNAPVKRTPATLGLDPLHGTREGRLTWRGQRYVDFDVKIDIRENTTAVLDLELPDEPISELILAAGEGNWELAELEIYGDGFVSQAAYTSNIIDLGARSSLGNLTWGGSVDQGAAIDLSVRTGDDEDPNFYWRLTFRGDEKSRFDTGGNELTRSSYRRLEGGERLPITPDRENWGFWTTLLDFNAGRGDLVSDKPRQFVQIKADFASTVGSAGGKLDYVEFEVSTPPVASQVLAEIAPTVTELGQTTPFVYKLLPEMQEDDLGFDSIQIKTPVAPASVDEVRIGSAVLSPGEFTVTPWDGENFSVHIPRVDLQSSGELIEVVFQSEVFKVGTVFIGRVYDSARPMEVRQRVTAGDADPLVEGNTLSVSPAKVGTRTIQALGVSAFTPNADGINDLLEVEYDLVNLVGGVPVALEVLNLAGVRVAGIPVETGISGRFSATWDGRDAQDRLLSPGLYLLRLKVDADEETDIEVATLPIAY